MSDYTEKFIYTFVYNMYGKCQIQIVHYVRFAVFRANYATKDENHSLSKKKKTVFLPSTPALWSYQYGNLGLVTHSGVIVKLPSNKG